MAFIVIGCLAFGFLYLFDINKISWRIKSINLCFAVGCALLAFSTGGILINGYGGFYIPLPFRVVFAVLAAAALALLVFSLFFALPVNQTYVNPKEENPVVDTGMYALCRHPGVIWFFLFYLFLWLASGLKLMLWAGLIWTIMDVIHVYIQDRWLFPQCLQDYHMYRSTTPFLVPTLSSMKRSVATFSGDSVQAGDLHK